MAKETAAFSSIKRMFGEYTSLLSGFKLVKEMTMKVSLYNLFRRMNKMDENNLRKTSYATEQKTSYATEQKIVMQQSILQTNNRHITWTLDFINTGSLFYSLPVLQLYLTLYRTFLIYF